MRQTTVLAAVLAAVFCLLLAAAPPSPAQAIPVLVHEVERLADGSTLITDGGNLTGSTPGIVFRVAADGTLLHSYEARTLWTHSAKDAGGGNVLVTDTTGDRVVEIAPDGTILWDSGSVSPFSDGSTLDYPNDAEPLPGGNVLISDRNHHRALEITRAGTVVWQFGTTGVPGAGVSALNGPHNVDRLPDGNTLVCDSNNDRILEISPAGTLVWVCQPAGAGALDWPRDADRLSDGTTIIADSNHGRLVRVDASGAVIATISTGGMPYDVDALPNGNWLVGGGTCRELTSAGAIVAAWPPLRTVTVETPAILNASSGVMLNVRVHVPSDAGPANRRPAVIRVPGGSGSGGGFELECDDWAKCGFVAVNFDPDGRGLSTNGGTYTAEDYNGFIQQDGLRAVLLHVAGRSDVDPERIVVFSTSYGITMAAGALARHAGDPPVALLVDFEGPASRAETASVNGGHVPIPLSNESFWAEREAVTFMPAIRSVYVRLQTAVDHVASIHPWNFHAVDLVNAALRAAFGGSGISPFTRVNGELINAADRPFSQADQPVWIAESLQNPPFSRHRAHLIIERCLGAPSLVAGGSLLPGGDLDLAIAAGASAAGRGYVVALSAGHGPAAVTGGAAVDLTIDDVVTATARTGILDGSGVATEGWALPSTASLSGIVLFGQTAVLTPELPLLYALSPAATIVFP